MSDPMSKAEVDESASTPPLLAIAGARATIRLNRPKHLNRLQPDDLEILAKLFDRIEADPAVRVMVLTGTGRAFSAGYDLNSVAARASSAVEPVIRVRDSRSFSDRSMISRSGVRLYLRRFSRSRSKVMTFSFIE